MLEMPDIERFIDDYYANGFVGRPTKVDWRFARAFVADAVLNLPTTEALLDRRKIDISRPRICNFSSTHGVRTLQTYTT